ncbi:MAG: hypothetical protein KDE58_14090 [Caldilineaceae bacterium]|nr:hypothetical protein [Caldilineaceae bacterium]
MTDTTDDAGLLALVARIRAAGLVVSLRADQAVDLLLEVGDALLAAPVLVVAIPMNHPEATALLAAYRERYGDHLLIGAGSITTMPTGTAALAAGAEFLLTSRYETSLHTLATRCGALYIPPATAPAALPALAMTNVLMATVQSSVLRSTAPWSPTSSPALLATATEHTNDITACARAGAAALTVEKLLFPTPSWSMPTMIRQARLLRRTWFAATGS